ncbi:MAG: hypothetical protein FJ387_08625 [Verrucomicrobia bacterium]|nr:hypothetical protein [Verrucomicrobiota bacterium]
MLKTALTSDGTGHLLPEPARTDTDGDRLSHAEERDLGQDPELPDSNGNQILDGIELAHALASQIDALPAGPSKIQTYRLDFQLKGLEHSAVCGTTVNMGHLVVGNPLAQLYVEVPYIALHYLEQGSFSFAGDVHGQHRLDVHLLAATLRSPGPRHIPKGPNDTDDDGLTDDQEKHFHSDPAVPDSNQDGVPDGFALARALWQQIDALPRTATAGIHALDHLLRGLVTCPVCGEQVNMGHLEIVNPPARLTLDMPYLALHALRHGSFAVSEEQRLDPQSIEAALRMPVALALEASGPTLRWHGSSLRSYQVLSAPSLTGPWTLGPVFRGSGKELTYTDSPQPNAPRNFYRIVAW